MDARLYVSGDPVFRLDGHDNIHLAIGELIDALPTLLVSAGPDDEIVLSIYIWPDDFANDSGFALEQHQTARLAELRCILNVGFLAANNGPLP